MIISSAKSFRGDQLVGIIGHMAETPQTSFSIPPASELGRTRSIRLPVPGSPFIGRKAELAEISFKLAKPDCRLMTVYGLSGMGKTRLALQAAREQASQFPNGVCYISMAALTDPDQVPVEAASALGFKIHEKMESTGPKRQLIDYLRNRRVLLLMDNFEHLVQATDFLSELLAEAPQVKILATSRERLNLSEEWGFRVSRNVLPAGGWRK